MGTSEDDGAPPRAHAHGPVPRVLVHSRYDEHGVYLSASPESTDLLGYAPQDLVGTSAYTYFHPEDLAIIAASHARVLGVPDTTSATYRMRHRDGHYITVTSTSVTHRDGAGGRLEIDSVTMAARLEPAVERPRTLEQEFAYLVERATSMVAVLDVELARVLYANPLLERSLGVEFGSLEGASFFELIDPGALPRVVSALSVLLHRPRGTTTLRCRLRHRDGSSVPVSMIVLDLTDDAAVGGLLVVAHEAAATEPAPTPTPPPTALSGATAGSPVDRPLLHQRLAGLLEDPASVPAGLALATVRLDDFDGIGAALGSDAADEVLRQASARIAAVLGHQASVTDVATLGAGRLAAITSGLAELVDARSFGERLRDLLSLPYHLPQGEVFLSPRVAVAVTQDGATADGLLAASHSTLEQAVPGARVAAFHATRLDVATARLRLRTELHHALERHELELHHQPVFDLRDNTVSGTEALIRWRHPERGLLAPAEFLGLAEESDLIHPLGIWVLRTACHQLGTWQGLPAGPRVVGVNVSAHQLLDARFPEAVTDALAVNHLAPEQLCLEITETAVLDPDGRAGATLDQLIRTGVQIAIDDFGTGHANLSYLKRIPAHVVKIDRSFVIGLDDDDPTDAAIVAGTIAMAHALGRSVTAEGVETAKQLAALRGLGCDRAQGNLLSRPVAAGEIAASVLAAGRQEWADR